MTMTAATEDQAYYCTYDLTSFEKLVNKFIDEDLMNPVMYERWQKMGVKNKAGEMIEVDGYMLSFVSLGVHVEGYFGADEDPITVLSSNPNLKGIDFLEGKARLKK